MTGRRILRRAARAAGHLATAAGRYLYFIRDAHNPFELFLAVGSAVVGAAVLSSVVLATVDPPPSIVATVPDRLQLLWAALLFLGGVLVLVGIAWKPGLLALRTEQVGLIALATGSIVYGIALLDATGLASAGPLLLAIGLASAWRAYQMETAMRRLIAGTGEPL